MTNGLTFDGCTKFLLMPLCSNVTGCEESSEYHKRIAQLDRGDGGGGLSLKNSTGLYNHNELPIALPYVFSDIL